MNNNQIIRWIKPYVNHILTRSFHGNGGIKRNCFFCRLSAFQEAFCSTRNFVNYILQWRSILLCLDRRKMGSCRAWRKICSASLNSTCEIQRFGTSKKNNNLQFLNFPGRFCLTYIYIHLSIPHLWGNLRSSFLLASLLCPLGYSALFPYPRNLWLWTAVLPGTLAFVHLILWAPQNETKK